MFDIVEKLKFEIAGLKPGDVSEINGIDVLVFDGFSIPLEKVLMWKHLEEFLNSLPDKVEPEISNTFSGGIYIREMFIPKGTFIVGKRHRYETCNIVQHGEISVYLGDDRPVSKMKGPLIMSSEPMVKKIGYAHEDTVFINMHPTNKTNLDEIEKEFIIPEDEYLTLIRGGN